jgi:O-antigen/teichoic acid export membrane protein
VIGPENAETSPRRDHSRFSTAMTTLVAWSLSTGLMLLNVLITARALGVEDRGAIAFLLVVAGLSSQAVLFGVHDANVLYGAGSRTTRGRLATNSVVLAVLFGALSMSVVLVLTTAVPALRGPASPELILLTLAAVPVSILRQYLAFLIQADYGFAVTNLATVAGPVTTVLVNGTLAFTGALTVGLAVGAWVGGQVLGGLILLVHIQRTAGFGRFDLPLARRCLTFGLKAHLGRTAWIGAERADVWIVGVLASPRELGLYSIAVAWADSIHYIPGLIATLLRPDLIRSTAADASELALRVFRKTCVVSASLGVFLLVAAPFLCVRVFGPEFEGAVGPLRILAFGAIAIAAVEILQNALVAMGHPWLGGAAVLTVLGVIVIGDLLLIPTLGIEGAAIANLAAWWIGGVTAALLFFHAGHGRVAAIIPGRQDLFWLPAKLFARMRRA